MKTIFDGSTLFISARSPFARRVRIALHEHEISFDEKVLDVFKKNPDYESINPLRRVPSLRLISGEVIVDSNLILNLLYHQIKSPFEPWGVADQIKANYWSGIAVGFCDRLVEYHLEKIRPQAKIDEEVVQEFGEIATDVLASFSVFLDQRLTILASGVTQADFDMGTALNYLSLRHNDQWKGQYPNLETYCANLNKRESFLKTVPPVA